MNINSESVGCRLPIQPPRPACFVYFVQMLRHTSAYKSTWRGIILALRIEGDERCAQQSARWRTRTCVHVCVCVHQLLHTHKHAFRETSEPLKWNIASLRASTIRSWAANDTREAWIRQTPWILLSDSFFFAFFLSPPVASSSSRQFNGKTINSLCVRVCVCATASRRGTSLCFVKRQRAIALPSTHSMLARASVCVCFRCCREDGAFISVFVVQMSWNEQVFIYYLCDHVLCQRDMLRLNCARSTLMPPPMHVIYLFVSTNSKYKWMQWKWTDERFYGHNRNRNADGGRVPGRRQVEGGREERHT